MPNKTPAIVSKAQLAQAAGGNAALKAMLSNLANAQNAQATKASNSGKTAPNQSAATLEFSNPYYIVTFSDPGGATALSPAQAAQQAALSSLGANPVQSVIYHQVQAATSILFDAAANCMTYGGDTGSLQTQFMLPGLDVTQQWYFRIRTSFDGQTWNQWKILNNGNATSVNAYAASVAAISGGSFVAITALGQQTVGFGVGTIPNGTTLQTAKGVLLQDSIAICGPNGYTDSGAECGYWDCTVDGNGMASIVYGDIYGHTWGGGNANFLSFGFAPQEAQNLTFTPTPDSRGRWTVIALPGGSRIAIGSGSGPNGYQIPMPAGFSAANMLGAVTPTNYNGSNHPAYGVSQAGITNGVCTYIYGDSTGHFWTSNLNWFAVAWEDALSPYVINVNNGRYIKLPTLSGFVVIGEVNVYTGGILPLPAGYTYDKCLTFTTPATYDNVLEYATHGVNLCTANTGVQGADGTVYCLYGTVTGSRPGTAKCISVAWL